MLKTKKQVAKEFVKLCYKNKFEMIVISIYNLPNTAISNGFEYQVIKANQKIDGFFEFKDYKDYVCYSGLGKFNLSETNRKFRKRLRLAVKKRKISVCPF